MSASFPENGLSVLIPDGESPLAPFVVDCLPRDKGWKIIILSDDPAALAWYPFHKQDFLLRGSSASPQAYVDAICQVLTQHTVDVLLPVGEAAIRTLSLFGKDLPASTALAPLPTTGMLDLAADKGSSARFFKQNALPAPDTIQYEPGGLFEQDLKDLAFPVLTKPRHGAGGEGIQFWEQPNELIAHLERSVDPQGFIIQSFIPGFNIDCSVLCREGRILAFTMQRELYPSRLRFGPATQVRFVHNIQAFEIAARLVRLLGWSGVAHIDMRFDRRDGKVKLLEINPRYWATVSGSMLAGVNFPYLACLASLGLEFPPPAYWPILYFSKGSLASLNILPEILRELIRRLAFLKHSLVSRNQQHG
jgi:biotin carboxylase